MNENSYRLIGMIIENVQNIEFLLVKGIRTYKLNNLFEKYKNVSPYLYQKVDLETKSLSDEMANMTFGQVMGIIRKQDFLSNDDIDYLESLLSKRNQLVHKFFKYNQMNNSNDLTKLNYLQNFYSESGAFLEYLENIVSDLENDLNASIGKKEG